MTPKKTMPLFLAMFTLVCALPAAGLLPPAIAQQEVTSLDEDVARSIVSDVLDGGGDDDEVNDDAADAEIDDQDSTDTATVNPNQDQTVDQTDSNEFGDNTAVSIQVDEEEEEEEQQSTATSPLDDGLPSEDAVFCFEEGSILGMLCSDTVEDCEFAQERFENVILECEGLETPPPDAAFCSISDEGKNIKCESRNEASRER